MPRRFDLLPVLPRLIREPIARIRFGFCSELQVAMLFGEDEATRLGKKLR